MQRIDDQNRVEKYRKDPIHEQRLREINQWLAPLEESFVRDYTVPNLPIVFLVGTPRSGSTLLSQILSSTGAFSYVSNFVARYWMAPTFASRMALALNFDVSLNHSPFHSEYGVTEGWSEPHEFGYFWERWFKFEKTHKIAAEKLSGIDFDSLRRQLAAWEDVESRPLIFKNLTCGLQLACLAKQLPTSCFVLCERDPVYTAQSILIARRERQGSSKHWFSLRPESYEVLRGLPYLDQIVGQIHAILGDIRTGLSQLSPDRCLEVRYEDICCRPRAEAEKILTFVAQGGKGWPARTCHLSGTIPMTNNQRVGDEEFEGIERACRLHFTVSTEPFSRR